MTAVTWQDDAPALAGLSPSDRTFLTATGLTPGTFGYLVVPPDPEVVPDGAVLAYDSDTPVVCTPRGVLALEADGERVVNASAEQFVASLHRMARYVEDVQAVDDEDAELEVVDATIADLRRIDATAWSDERNYWPIIGAQMTAGML